MVKTRLRRHVSFFRQVTAGTPMTPPILIHAGELLSRYDVLFCDVWGVVHDGLKAFPAACDALVRFRANGGTVVLVSNAPVPQEQVMAMLTTRAVPREAYDAIVSSGDIALAYVQAQRFGALHCIGPQDRDSALFSKLTARQTELAEADAILCSGLTNDLSETAESYLPLLEAARARNLPFVCANPDLVVDVGGKLYLCAGAIADVYTRIGGSVFWAGKPHPNAYGTALEVASRLRSDAILPHRILAIGDAVRTDLKAAQNAGVAALFVAGGIHRHDTMADGVIDPARLASLLGPGTPPALAATAYLAW
jgi:HAD superfamily hydrolase (TIGR01459 family)